MSTTHIFGIRHHGPGSARNMLKALEEVKPDVLLIEGPPEGEVLLEWVKHQDMRPPVAMLAYVPNDPQVAVFYPFTTFSPEWQAIQYALKVGIPIRFMDMPLTHKLAMQLAEREAAMAEASAEDDTGNTEEAKEVIENKEPIIRRQPISYLAEIAGYSDAEEWWEQHFEFAQHPLEVFEVLNEAMSALREELEDKIDQKEAIREAFMRQAIRKATKEKFQSIGVVCGAWHTPALHNMPSQKADKVILKGLPKTKTEITWIPWTNDRLMMASGYGAGITSPGWYEHNWIYPEDDGAQWLAKTARVFRAQQKDISAAHIIEAVRLTGSLVHLRNLQKPGLSELNEAVQTVMCMGDPMPLVLLEADLIVGKKIGQVPEGTPRSPLQRDFELQLKKLRLKLSQEDKALVLDLRKELDRGKSALLHRLNLIGIDWGHLTGSNSKGTFKESWRLYWKPEQMIGLIEKASYGNTILGATEKQVVEQMNQFAQLDEIVSLLNRVLPADLPSVMSPLIQKMDTLAANTTDTLVLMRALLPLVDIQRYGNVRQTNQEMIGFILQSIFYRMLAGLNMSCSNINEEQAKKTGTLIQQIQQAIPLLAGATYAEDWQSTLHKLLDSSQTAPFIQGLVLKILYDAQQLSQEEMANHFSRALSENNDPAIAALWLEGFLNGAAMILILDDQIWQIIFNWVSELESEVFDKLLPLLRRSFADYTDVEKAKIGAKVKQGKSSKKAMASNTDIHLERALRVVPVLKELMGIS